MVLKINERTLNFKPFYKRFGFFLLLYAISRFFSLFEPDLMYTFHEIAVWGDALIQRGNIYALFRLQEQGLLTIKYPPLYYIQIAFNLILFGYSIFSIRLGFIFWEIGGLILLFFLSKAYYFEKEKVEVLANNKALIILYIYSFSPITILSLIYSPVFSIGQIYFIGGLYTFYKNKIKLMSILFCIGFMTQIYHIFCVIPICIYFLSQKKWKELRNTIVFYAITFIIFSIPFVLMDLTGFLFSYIVHGSRIPQAASIWMWIWFVFPDATISLSFFGIISISYLMLTVVLFILFFSISCFQYFRKQRNLTRTTIFHIILAFYLCLPLIFLSYDLRYTYWFFPLLCLFSNGNSERKGELLAYISIVVCFILGFFVFLLDSSSFLIDARIYIEYSIEFAKFQLFTLFVYILLLAFIPLWLYHEKDIKYHRLEYNNPNLQQTISIFATFYAIQAFLLLSSTNALYSFLFLSTIVVCILLNIRNLSTLYTVIKSDTKYSVLN